MCKRKQKSKANTSATTHTPHYVEVAKN